MKYTKKEVVGMFDRLLRALGHKHGSAEGEWSLDYISCYGGYLIVENGENGAENHPFGALRRNAKEMYLSMLMAIVSLEKIKEKQ